MLGLFPGGVLKQAARANQLRFDPMRQFFWHVSRTKQYDWAESARASDGKMCSEWNAPREVHDSLDGRGAKRKVLKGELMVRAHHENKAHKPAY